MPTTKKNGVSGDWFLYVLECADGTFYTGVTTNTNRRLQEHNDTKKAAKYTRARQPVKLAYVEKACNRSEALKREAAIKKLSRTQKLQLIEQGLQQKVDTNTNDHLTV